MSDIVNWEYYSSHHVIQIPENDFDKYVRRAENEIRAVTGWPRWNNIDPEAFYYDQLRDCICQTMNALYESDNSAGTQGVTSVSNDGYSESYKVLSASEMAANIKSRIKHLLSGTGLTGAY